MTKDDDRYEQGAENEAGGQAGGEAAAERGGGDPELDQIVRQYLDLWQTQWTLMANDPAMADAMARLFKMIGQPVAAANLGAMMAFGQSFQQNFGQSRPVWPGWPQEAPQETHHQAYDTREGNWAEAYDPAARRADANRRDAAADATGATSDAPPHADGTGHLAELTGRLEALERRLADLASALERTGLGTKGADPSLEPEGSEFGPPPDEPGKPSRH